MQPEILGIWFIDYLDFANTQLLVKTKITRGNGDDITDADHVGGVNLFPHSLFQQVDVSLNDVQVSQSAGSYAYRAYIESLLSYGPKAKTSQLTAALYYNYTAGNMGRPNPEHANAAERNYGLQKQASFTDRGVIVDMICRIHSDVFFHDRYMPEWSQCQSPSREKQGFVLSHVWRSEP